MIKLPTWCYSWPEHKRRMSVQYCIVYYGQYFMPISVTFISILVDKLSVQYTVHSCVKVINSWQSLFSAINKLVVLSTSWRDSYYERFTLVWKTNSIKQPERQLASSSYNHNTLTTLRISVKESLQLHFKVAVRNFHALSAIVMIPSQVFWGFSACFGGKINW